MKKILLFFILLFIVNNPVSAARMPDIIQKKFVFDGNVAKQIMKSLDLPTLNSNVFYLPWRLNKAKCYKDTNEDGPVYEYCDPKIRINKIEYIASDFPKVIFSGYWYDGETGSMPDVPRFSFSSPNFYSKERLGDWKRIISSDIEDLNRVDKNFIDIFNKNILLRISKFKKDGLLIYNLGIDDRPEQIRKIAEDNYKKCIKNLKGRGGGC